MRIVLEGLVFSTAVIWLPLPVIYTSTAGQGSEGPHANDHKTPPTVLTCSETAIDMKADDVGTESLQKRGIIYYPVMSQSEPASHAVPLTRKGFGGQLVEHMIGNPND